MNTQLRSLRFLRLFAAALALAATTSANAQQHPTLARGFSAEKSFQVGELDNVNLFNGNLVVTLPIGQRFKTGGDFEYGLTLVYNSNVWEIDDVIQSTEGWTVARNHPLDNAGLGWNLSLGRLLEPNDPNNDRLLTFNYISPDGAEHQFADVLRVGQPVVEGVKYAVDGSFLRLVLTPANAPTVAKVQFPDGDVHEFQKYGARDWRLTKISDPFGNWLQVGYTNPNLWTLVDNFQRTHTVEFQTLGVGEAARKVVSRVSLASPLPNGSSAIYDLAYTAPRVQRGCPNHTDASVSKEIYPPVLDKITLPDLSRYQVATNTDYNSALDCSPTSGRMSKLTLPTGGFYAWTYREYLLSVAGADTECSQRSPILRQTFGVGTRTMSTGGTGAVAGTWTYTPAFRPEPIGPQQRCNAPREAWTTIEDPQGDKTVSYFSIHRWDGNQPNLEGWSTYEFGEPFTRYANDGAGRFLSKEFFDCPASGTPIANCTALRKSYVRYENSGGFEFQSINPRVASERTFYLDDLEGSEAVWSSTDNSDYDGLGHYRQTVSDGNFIAGRDNSRTSHTDWNGATGLGAIPAQNAPWLLGLFTEQWTEARKNSQAPSNLDREYSQYCFNGSTGVLERKRTMLGSAPQGKDLILETLRNAKGDVTSERYFGGDNQTVGTGALCGLTLTNPTYAVERTVAVNRTVNDSLWTISSAPSPSLGFKLEDQDFHPRSGLMLASRDSAGVPTTYEYDVVGRLRFARPLESAETEVKYTLPTAANPSVTPKVELLQKNPSNGQELTRSEFVFDGLGRVTQERRRTAGTTASGTFSVRETKYDGMGHVISVSEFGDGGATDLAKKTTFAGFDPFGRAKTTTAPDGAVHESTFVGIRSVTQKSFVATALDGSESATCRIETYDRHGRLAGVAESATATCSQEGQFIGTRYGYDVGNRLTWARTVDPATSTTQFREFGYDHRGFLNWEDGPEKATAQKPNCDTHDVCYAQYDAKGHAHRKAEGSGDLEYDFDAAERLLRVRYAGSASTCTGYPSNCLTEYVYGSGTTASDRSLGKVQVSRRFHDPGTPAGSGGFLLANIVQYTYTYGGRNGAVSKKLLGHGAWLFETRQTLDLLGNLETVTYPFGPGGTTEPAHFYIDVPASNPARPEIDQVGIGHFVDACLYNSATGESSYCPNNTMTRGELATPLLRARYANGYYTPPSCQSTGYSDVSCSASYGPWVAKAQQDGLLTSCGAGLYCPNQTATRANLARFFLKAQNGSGFTPPACATPMFADVPCSDPDAPWINEFARRGLGGGCGNGSFCPSQGFNRTELARALAVGASLSLTINPSTQRVVQYAYDNGLLQRVELMGMPYAKLAYAPNLTVSQVVHGNGVVDTIATDPKNLARPRSIASTNVTGATLWSTGLYSYDGSGNLKKVGANSYTYDRLSRLVDARFYLDPTTNATLRGQSYSFDAFGNLNQINAVIAGSSGYATPTDPATNRLSGGTTEYDNSGNLRIWNGSSYKFDALNQLVSYTNSTGDSWAYYYDANGERVFTIRQVPGPSGAAFQERWTLRDAAGRLLREIYWDWTQWSTFLPSLGNEMNDYVYRGDQLAAIETPFATRHLSLDHLGTPRLSTDRLGVKTAYHVYYPFGEEATAFNQDTVRAKFTGHERDLNNPSGAGDDIDYLHARFYSPVMGRFLSVDPKPSSDPFELPNRYAYSRNNPLNLIDPTGNAPEEPQPKVTLFLGVGGGVAQVGKHKIEAKAGIEFDNLTPDPAKGKGPGEAAVTGEVGAAIGPIGLSRNFRYTVTKNSQGNVIDTDISWDGGTNVEFGREGKGAKGHEVSVDHERSLATGKASETTITVARGVGFVLHFPAGFFTRVYRAFVQDAADAIVGDTPAKLVYSTRSAPPNKKKN